MAKGEFQSIDFKWAIQNEIDFARTLDRYATVASDFTPAFIPIAADWYRGNRQIFTLQSAGLYQDLSPTQGAPTTTSNYKEQKKKKLGFAYPILVGESRKLSNSILGKTNKGSIFTMRKRELSMGTSIDYAKYHQSDDVRRVMPQRKFVFISGGIADKARGAAFSGRRERWLNIVNDQIVQKITGRVL